MWRFLFPALAMTAALIVLFPGALRHSSSWLDLSDGALAIISGAEPRHSRSQLAPALPVAAFPEQQAAWDALQRQVADLQNQTSELQEQTSELQNQIEQRSHDLEQDKAQAKRTATAKAPPRPRAPSPAPPLKGTNNCGTPDEPKPCPPMPRHPLPFYPADRE
jgi:TolA-binding protein